MKKKPSRKRNRDTAITIAHGVSHYAFLVLLMNVREIPLNFWIISSIVALGVVAICMWAYVLNKDDRGSEAQIEGYLDRLTPYEKDELLSHIERKYIYKWRELSTAQIDDIIPTRPSCGRTLPC